MKRVFLYILLWCTISVQAYSQSFFSHILNGETDSVYIDELTQMFTVKGYSSKKLSDFSVSDDRLMLSYKSNPTKSLGVGFSYKWLGFSFGYGFPFANKDGDIYGRSKGIDFSTQFYLRKLTVSVFSSIYRGFYLDNSAEVLNWPDSLYYQRGDIKNLILGVGADYFFNYHKYSNIAIFGQTEWQKKSAGSFVLGGGIFFNRVMADSSIFPAAIIDSGFVNYSNYTYSDYFALTSKAGYTFTLVGRKHWFFNFGLMAGLAFGRTTVLSDNENELSAFKGNVSLQLNSGFGYNSARFYAGYTYSYFFAASATSIEKTTLGFGSGVHQFVVAYRFGINPEKQFLPEWSPVKL